MQTEIQRIIDPALARIDAVLGSAYSAVLYGSGARGEFLPGTSDVNLLLVCDSLGPALLRRLYPALAGLRDAHQPSPLLIEREEWRRAGDVFPIEITDMQHAAVVLRGADPVAALRVDRRDLRRALEAELRAKLLRLRQVYALRAGEPKELGLAALRTASSVAALLRGAMLLHGATVAMQTLECLAAAESALAVPTGPVREFWNHRGNRKYVCAPEMFEEYVSSVRAAVGVVDRFTIPGGD